MTRQNLNATLAELMKRNTMAGLPHMEAHTGSDRLIDFAFAGSNPGALRALCHVPAGLSAGAPLVVVLHGCTQTAGDYDMGSGWSQLADEHGFAVLFPEQQRANNPNLCFNWFSPVDSRRDSGEALSIRQMIAAMVAAYGLDERRIFVTGLSAGGAMASIMLATYPEIFAGGAIIAGLPFGSARSVGDALARMRGDGFPSHPELGALVADATDHDGPWPRISVWHGSADTVVDPSNAGHIAGQWQAVHGLHGAAATHDSVEGNNRRSWRNAAGDTLIEVYDIAGMGHGTPLDTRGIDGCGTSGPYMLEAGISSTRHIAHGWGIAPSVPATNRAKPATARPTVATPRPRPVGVNAIIEDSLRAAGLMR